MAAVAKHTHGWPRLSAFVDSDPNFMIYRRFGWLRTRTLMYHQDVLREMEKRLEDLDWADFSDCSTRRAMCWREGDDARNPALRKELFTAVSSELQLYGKLRLSVLACTTDRARWPSPEISRDVPA